MTTDYNISGIVTFGATSKETLKLFLHQYLLSQSIDTKSNIGLDKSQFPQLQDYQAFSDYIDKHISEDTANEDLFQDVNLLKEENVFPKFMLKYNISVMQDSFFTYVIEHFRNLFFGRQPLYFAPRLLSNLESETLTITFDYVEEDIPYNDVNSYQTLLFTDKTGHFIDCFRYDFRK